MKCLNPACDSLDANEINVSMNLTHTDEDGEYTGTTDYGDCSAAIGTWCSKCDKRVLFHDWQQIVADEFDQSFAIEREWTIVLPEPTFVYVVAWYTEQGGEQTSGGFEWRISKENGESLFKDMARENADYLVERSVVVFSCVAVPPNIEEGRPISEYLNGMTDALEGRAFDNTVRVIAVSINERRSNT